MRAVTAVLPLTVPVALKLPPASVSLTNSTSTRRWLPGATKLPYLTFFASFSTAKDLAKSVRRCMTHPAAWVSASSIMTPGSTGKLGKWSAKYSSASETCLVATIRCGEMDSTLSRRLNFMPIEELPGSSVSRGLKFCNPKDSQCKAMPGWEPLPFEQLGGLDPHLHVGVPPRALAEKGRRPAGLADERPQHPAHLDPHEGVQDQPHAHHLLVPGVARDQRGIKPLEQPLRREAGHSEHQPVEQ